MSHTTPVDERANRGSTDKPGLFGAWPGAALLPWLCMAYTERACGIRNKLRPALKRSGATPPVAIIEQRKCIVVAVYEVEEAAKTLVLPAACQNIQVSVRLYAACASICLVYLPLRAALLHFAR